MNAAVPLLILAIVCDGLLIGIFFRDYKKTKDRAEILFILGFFLVFFICFYFLLENLEIVIVLW